MFRIPQSKGPHTDIEAAQEQATRKVPPRAVPPQRALGKWAVGRRVVGELHTLQPVQHKQLAARHKRVLVGKVRQDGHTTRHGTNNRAHGYNNIHQC